ncbi:MAG: phosphoglycerate kinase [Candidatus Woesearchaeota archaeon]|jgi:3-phosphoglycerate kinase|nr:phosphoglycerate kinase [Candidatus Woesearchaeota archaeon]
MEYKTIKDLDVSGKRVLVRVEFNVKLNKGEVGDDTRIKESLPTLKYLLEKNARLILLAHLGRPQDELSGGKSVEDVKKDNSLAPVAKHLSGLLGMDVKMAPDSVGDEVRTMVNELKDGGVLLLENLRLYKEELDNDCEFAKTLASYGDIFVFDGFGVAHRVQASPVGVPLEMIAQGKEVAAGLLMDKELRLWEEARKKEGHRLLVIGGKKLNEKVKAVGNLYKAVDSVLVGGAVYNIIIAGKGIAVGDSLIEEKGKDYTGKGKELSGEVGNLLLAKRVVIAKKGDFSDYREISVDDGVPNGYMITDIVIDDDIKAEIEKAQVVIWFGNIGISDAEVNGAHPFAKGTEDFKKTVSKNAYVIVGGGDSITASEGLANSVISTGGGAAIALYTTGTLDALEALKGNKDYFN